MQIVNNSSEVALNKNTTLGDIINPGLLSYSLLLNMLHPTLDCGLMDLAVSENVSVGKVFLFVF